MEIKGRMAHITNVQYHVDIRTITMTIMTIIVHPIIIPDVNVIIVENKIDRRTLVIGVNDE